MKRQTTGLLLIGMLAAASAAHGDSIVNGGFEAASFAGWTVDSATNGSELLVGGHGHLGTDAAWFGAMGAWDDSISQTFATQPGQLYEVSFWLAHGATDRANDFGVLWDSTPLLLLTNARRFGETQYTFFTTADDDHLTTLRFSGRALLDYYYLDDVSVVPLPTLAPAALVPTPEPATLALLLCSGLAFAGWTWAKSRRPLAAPR